METLYYYLGYETEIIADERQKHLKHLALKQIKESKKIVLKQKQVEIKPLLYSQVVKKVNKKGKFVQYGYNLPKHMEHVL